MEAHPNAASMLRSRTIIPSFQPSSLLALSTRLQSPLPSPLPSPSPSPSITSSSQNPKPSFHRFAQFSNTHTLESMTLSKCISQRGPTVPISGQPEPEPGETLVVVSFYKFADFPDHALMRNPLKQLCQRLVLTFSIIHSFKAFDFVISN